MTPSIETARVCADIAERIDSAYGEQCLTAHGTVDLYTENGTYCGSIEFRGEGATVLSFRDGM